MNKPKILCASAMLLGLLALPIFAQTANDPNRPATDTTTVARQDRDDNRNNYGWIGLIGLAGLAGLFRKQHSHNHVPDSRTTGTNRV